MTQAELKALLMYKPSTGRFFWRVNRGRLAKAGSVAGYVEFNGYSVIRVMGRDYKAHRLAVLYMTGKWPPYEVDHINRIKTDNRWRNLRLATKSQNQANSPTTSRNKLGIKGVHKRSIRGYTTFIAQIKHNGRVIHLGCFVDAEQARLAYAVAAKKLHGKFARLE